VLARHFLFLWSLAFLSPVVAIFFAARCYALHSRRRPQSERRFPLVGYVLVLFLCAIIAYSFGLYFGNSWACSSPQSGNLCGLIGIFVAGPFSSALAIFLVSGLILLLPADDAPIAANDTPSQATTRWYRKLWQGQYSFARSFWGFFILGTFVGVIIGMNPVFLFLPVFLFFLRFGFQLCLFAYEITAGVGVWRSANILIAARGPSVKFNGSMKIIAAKTIVVLVIGFYSIRLLRIGFAVVNHVASR
jgi:hypothetical protein